MTRNPRRPRRTDNFLLIRREVYEAIGGHARFAGEVAGRCGVGWRGEIRGAQNLVWEREGNCARADVPDLWCHVGRLEEKSVPVDGRYALEGFREGESVFPWVALLVILLGIKFPAAMFAGVLLLLLRQTSYGSELVRNQYPLSFIIYYVPAVFLYTGVLAASYLSHRRGRVLWKGREYRVDASGRP